MLRERTFGTFRFGSHEIQVCHPVGTQEDYGAILQQKKNIFVYEATLSHLIKNNVLAGDLFLDIGAQIGLFSIHAALQQATVISFEMRPSIVHCHFETKERNGLGNWLPLPFAIGERVSQIPISDDAQFALVGEQTSGINPESSVSCINLDSLQLHTMFGRRPAFIKLDVEGFEIFALRGMRMFTQTMRPMMAIECHPHAAWGYGTSISELRSLLPVGYRLHLCTTHRNESEKGELIPLTDDLPHLDNYMLLASPSEQLIK